MTTGAGSRRFPWVALGFCVVCLCIAAWTWMRWSYACAVTPRDFWSVAWSLTDSDPEPAPNLRLVGRYVMLCGKFERLEMHGVSLDIVNELEPPESSAFVGLAWGSLRPESDAEVSLTGRVVLFPDDALVLDMESSRFTWQGISGPIVGLMGVVALGVSVWRWRTSIRAA